MSAGAVALKNDLSDKSVLAMHATCEYPVERPKPQSNASRGLTADSRDMKFNGGASTANELDTHQYRDRSVAHPEHDEAAQAARQASHPPPREYIPMEEPTRYSPAEAPVRYRYAEPPPIYVDEYGRPIEVVRVREPYPPTRYISEQDRLPVRYVSEHHGPSEQAYEYVPYETTPSRDDRRYVYYADQPPYEEHERRVYEPVPEPPMVNERLSERPAGPPGQEVRYVEQQR
ncbi:hypothetical protein H2199_001221 [Coniosporium tulheliwenetii]|uniref:Uncharacterized protein n=1 Tax=Coniosporium tulheliwenetii TaxID=3383036 RepID=A0ACC2ZLD0_9PEZI|nr:hypothetical protein H2199_001221 [Cladosporium sp. JES 115]